MKPATPNVSIRSNVFVRVSSELSGDIEFCLQVRGREAILGLLRRISPDQEGQQLARTCLSKAQLAELAWQTPCAICGARPEGVVKGPQGAEIRFRCPRGTCPTSNLIPRTILVDVELVRALAAKFHQTLPEVVPVALRSFDPAQSATNHAVQMLPSGAGRRRVVVLLTRTQYHFLTDTDISDALCRFLEHGNVVG